MQADVGQGKDEKRPLSRRGIVAGNTTEKRFHTRGFISLLTGFSLAVMTVTGIVLYFVPQGRIASWTNWQILRLTRTDWVNIHTTSSILFAVCAGYHLYLNWKVFFNYVVNKLSGTLSLKKEQAAATVIILFVVFGTIYYLPPLNYVVQFSDYLKASWVKSKEQEPPFGHAEQLSLKVLAKRTNIDVEMAVAELRDRGILIDSDGQTLEQVARKNGVSPMAIYAIMMLHSKKETPSIERAGLGEGQGGVKGNEGRRSTKEPGMRSAQERQGYTPEMIEEQLTGKSIGKKTIEELCSEFHVKTAEARKRLKTKGIDVKDGETLKEAATRHQTTPIQIAKIALAGDAR